MKILAVIPARYASSRLPGKPLLELGGKPMIQRVAEQVKQCDSFTEVVVATDDERIMDVVKSLGLNAVMTSADHPSGTDRCKEALLQQEQEQEREQEQQEADKDLKYDYVVNIQGDEPFINPNQLDQFCQLLNGSVEIASQYVQIHDDTVAQDPNKVKVVTNDQGCALYFSRSAIPFRRNDSDLGYKQHIGLYAYRSDVLNAICKLPPSPLELTEGLEQLRWLEAGYTIQMQETAYPSIGIDTAEDLEEARKRFE